MRTGLKLAGSVVGSILAITTPSMAQKGAVKADSLITKTTKTWNMQLMHRNNRANNQPLDITGFYSSSLNGKAGMAEFGIGLPEILKFNKTTNTKKYRPLQGPPDPKNPNKMNRTPGKPVSSDYKESNIASLSIDKATVGFQPDTALGVQNYFRFESTAKTGNLVNLGKNIGIKLQNIFKFVTPFVSGSHKGNGPRVENLIGPSITAKIGDIFETDVVVGLATGKKAGLGFNFKSAVRIVENLFGYANYAGTVGAKNSEVQAGMFYRIK